MCSLLRGQGWALQRVCHEKSLDLPNLPSLGLLQDFCLLQESKSSLSIVTRKVLDYLEAYQKLE